MAQRVHMVQPVVREPRSGDGREVRIWPDTEEQVGHGESCVREMALVGS